MYNNLTIAQPYFMPLIVDRSSKGVGIEAPMVIVHHDNNHRNLAWRRILQPRQMGSPGKGGGGGIVARELQKKNHNGKACDTRKIKTQ